MDSKLSRFQYRILLPAGILFGLASILLYAVYSYFEDPSQLWFILFGVVVIFLAYRIASGYRRKRDAAEFRAKFGKDWQED